jgi:hypothetical protein
MKKILLLLILLDINYVNGQFVYPPNYSFENDSIPGIPSNWESNIKFGLISSVGINRKVYKPTDGRFLYNIYS